MDADFKEEFLEALDLTEDRLKDVENILAQALAKFNEGMIANQQGLANVYTKFLELEKRQKDIEDLLHSEHLSEIVNLIPTQEDVSKWLAKIQDSDISKLKEKIIQIREDLEDLTDRFTF